MDRKGNICAHEELCTPCAPCHLFYISEGGLSALFSFGSKSRCTGRVGIFGRLGLRDTTELADQSDTSKEAGRYNSREIAALQNAR